MQTLKFLGICGSLRRQSTNAGLLRAAMAELPAGVTMDIANLLDVPFYNADLTEKPASVQRLLAQMAEADALVFGCPEYNYSLAPALKNALDWASREPNGAPFAGKPAAIMGAGGGMGSSRSQYHLRQVCVFFDLHFVNKPEVFANAFSSSFDADGNLIDPKLIQLIATQMQNLTDWTRKLKG